MSQARNDNLDQQPDDDAALNALSGLNPVDPNDIPSAHSSKATALLDSLMGSDQRFSPYEAPELATPAGPGVPYRSRSGLLAAVAAVAFLLIGGAVVLSPTSSTPAMAAVSAATANTSLADSGRAVTTFEVVGREGDEEAMISGVATTVFNSGDVAITANVDKSSFSSEDYSKGHLEGLDTPETRIVDGKFYVKPDGDQWYAVEAPDAVVNSVNEYTDARGILDLIEEITDVTEAGTETIDDIVYTRFRGSIDAADEDLYQLLPGGVAGPEGELKGLIAVELLVNDDLVRRITISADLAPSDADVDGEATLRFSTDFTDLGADLVIEAPTDAQEISLTD